MQVRTLVVDDHPAFRLAVRSLLASDLDLEFIGEAADGADAVLLAEQLKPDLILLDINLPTLNGLEAATRIAAHAPCSKVLFLSQECSFSVVERAFEVGAYGYVAKSDAAGGLLNAVHTVIAGDRFLGRRFVDPLRSRLLHTLDTCERSSSDGNATGA